MEQYPLRALSLLAFLLAPVVTTAETIVERGHSAVWYDPARSGEGWLVEILDSDLATITWFTYDEQGNQRWLYGVGHIEADEAGSYIRFAQLFSTHGGRFGPEFDPTDVQHVTVGEATLRFADCERGVFSYSAYDQTQAIEIQRLSRTMAAGCAPVHGVPGQPVFEYAGQSGSWYDTSHSGEGFQLQWSEDNRALLTWYSYDTDGDQYWMIGTGQYENGRIVFPELFSTRGARFGAGFDSTDVELIPWGSLVFELTCNEGTASYDSSLPEFGSGTQQLSRLTIAASLDCPWTAPKLSDLYSFSLRELPVSVPGHHLDRVQSRSIADDGTVVGVIGTDGSGNFQLLRIRPDESEWQILTAVEVGFWPVTIAPSGAHVVANRQVAPDPSRAYEPSLFRSDSGWEPLWNLILSNSRASGSSQDAFHVVGTGRNESGSARPWIWSAEKGQIELPLSDNIRIFQLRAASNDGNVVVGESPKQTDEGLTGLRAVRWTAGMPPEALLDANGVELGVPTTCDADCSLIFGAGQAFLDSQHPNYGEGWYWKVSGAAGYFGRRSDGSASFALPLDVSSDGSLVVGADERGDAIIWTQNTGIVSVRSILADQGFAGTNWRDLRAVSVTSDGRMVLLWGIQDHVVPQQPSIYRSAVLLLDEKSSN